MGGAPRDRCLPRRTPKFSDYADLSARVEALAPTSEEELMLRAENTALRLANAKMGRQLVESRTRNSELAKQLRQKNAEIASHAAAANAHRLRVRALLALIRVEAPSLLQDVVSVDLFIDQFVKSSSGAALPVHRQRSVSPSQAPAKLASLATEIVQAASSTVAALRAESSSAVPASAGLRAVATAAPFASSYVTSGPGREAIVGLSSTSSARLESEVIAGRDTDITDHPSCPLCHQGVGPSARHSNSADHSPALRKPQESAQSTGVSASGPESVAHYLFREPSLDSWYLTPSDLLGLARVLQASAAPSGAESCIAPGTLVCGSCGTDMAEPKDKSTPSYLSCAEAVVQLEGELAEACREARLSLRDLCAERCKTVRLEEAVRDMGKELSRRDAAEANVAKKQQSYAPEDLEGLYHALDAARRKEGALRSHLAEILRERDLLLARKNEHDAVVNEVLGLKRALRSMEQFVQSANVHR